ncbi:acyltransferase family protein [Pseudomonas palmensis]|uniref:acyltransferase family protein n=1 Tax=Pseudomonas palmensis TaxID=2815362 RepID=UPI0039E9D4B2
MTAFNPEGKVSRSASSGMGMPTYRAAIDGLRAIAVLGVVLFHMNPAWLPGGFVGVDVFFVISGYLISLIVFHESDSGRFSFAHFYARRARRLFPALILVLLAVIGFGWFALFTDEYKLLARHVTSAVTFVANLRLMQEAGYFDVASHLKPLLHLWSLAIEEQFYLVWPVLLVAAARFKFARVWLLGLFFLLSAGVSIYLYFISAPAHFFNPISRFWELLAGAALAYCRLYRPSLISFNVRQSNWIGGIGVGLIGAAYALLSGGSLYPSVLALLPVLGTMLVITAQGGITERLLSLRPLVWVGLISYPLYLWHWPIFSYLQIVESGKPSLYLLLLGAALAVVLSWLTYAVVEKRVRYSHSRWVIVGLVLCLLGLFTAGKYIQANDGLADRQRLQYLQVSAQQMIREPRFDAQCAAFMGQVTPPVYCRMQPGSHLLAIIGDSHAHVVYAGLAELRAREGLGTILLANSGCPPFSGSTFGRNAKERDTCAESIERILAKVERSGDIREVLIASRGPQYIDGTGFGDVEKNYNYPPLLDAQGHDVPPDQVFKQGVSTTIDRLQRSGKHVVYMLQVPELGVSPRDCQGRPLHFNHQTSCQVSRQIYQERMAKYRTLMDSVAKEREIALFDPLEYMCDADVCYMSRDGVLLYADDNHLSVAGSRRLAPALARFFTIKRMAEPAPAAQKGNVSHD